MLYNENICIKSGILFEIGAYMVMIEWRDGLTC
nr:MAG TPA: hypothetical protein [Caudoviricetes sp.]